MKELLHSFVAGMGSVLSICPQLPSDRTVNVVEVMGSDFTRVGGDLARAMEAKGATLSQVEGASNGQEEGKAEQLTFIQV